MADNKAFLECVAQHERGWGDEQYKGRPTLSDIMKAQVIAFWLPASDELPPTITIHNNLKDIEAYLVSLVWHSSKQLPKLRLSRVFVKQREIKIKAVRVAFDYK